MLGLTVAHTGPGRFGRARPSPPVTAPAPTETPRLEAYDSVPTGPLRLAHPNLATQFAWLLPIAVLGLLLTRRPEAGSLALCTVSLLPYCLPSTPPPPSFLT